MAVFLNLDHHFYPVAVPLHWSSSHPTEVWQVPWSLLLLLCWRYVLGSSDFLPKQQLPNPGSSVVLLADNPNCDFLRTSSLWYRTLGRIHLLGC